VLKIANSEQRTIPYNNKKKIKEKIKTEIVVRIHMTVYMLNIAS